MADLKKLSHEFVLGEDLRWKTRAIKAYSQTIADLSHEGGTLVYDKPVIAQALSETGKISSRLTNTLACIITSQLLSCGPLY